MVLPSQIAFYMIKPQHAIIKTMDDLQRLRQQAKDQHIPVIMDDGLTLLCDTVIATNAKTILEIGTAVGTSAIAMASLSNDITIDTYEIDPLRIDQAIKNIHSMGLDDQITVYGMDILDALITKKYDLIFIDGAKNHYFDYVVHTIDHIQPYGCYIIDNLNFHGIVDQPSLTHNRSTKQLVAKIKHFRQWILTNDWFNTVLYDKIGDGIAIVWIKDKSKVLQTKE